MVKITAFGRLIAKRGGVESAIRQASTGRRYVFHSAMLSAALNSTIDDAQRDAWLCVF